MSSTPIDRAMMSDNDLFRLRPNRTSGRFLYESFAQRIQQQGNDATPEDVTRCLMLQDLYIKARGFAIVNKILFWPAVLGCLAVVLWPLLIMMLRRFGSDGAEPLSTVDASILQTMFTGLTAVFALGHRHYKHRQTRTENLMRFIAFRSDSADDLIDRVIGAMSEIDGGFNFEWLMGKDAQSGGQEASE